MAGISNFIELHKWVLTSLSSDCGSDSQASVQKLPQLNQVVSCTVSKNTVCQSSFFSQLVVDTLTERCKHNVLISEGAKGM